MRDNCITHITYNYIYFHIQRLRTKCILLLTFGSISFLQEVSYKRSMRTTQNWSK